MKIAIVGYGKMGREIEKIALEHGHSISHRISAKNADQIGQINPENTDVAIEFTNPGSAFDNLSTLLNNQVSCVCGSTGWTQQGDLLGKFIDQIKLINSKEHTGLIIASNFSLGVNLFFQAAKRLSGLMKKYTAYYAAITETHHVQKKDAPSGTALTLQSLVSAGLDQTLPDIVSHRLEEVPGTHELIFTGEDDEIRLTHVAFNRHGFALGAVMAAEFLQGKSGYYTMDDVLQLHEELL